MVGGKAGQNREFAQISHDFLKRKHTGGENLQAEVMTR